MTDTELLKKYETQVWECVLNSDEDCWDLRLVYFRLESDIRQLGLSIRDQTRLMELACTELNLVPELNPDRIPLLDFVRSKMKTDFTIENVFAEFGLVLMVLEVKYLNEN